ncbi:hypothetical protein [Pseudomonas amygdali]|uniref:hypothetical protein n=1 Tax=Pseudomonas amygdali TaxID=47877 RepID=UPI0006B9B11C|nr:hypothetical protein [Pseudomonas amygdali]
MQAQRYTLAIVGQTTAVQQHVAYNGFAVMAGVGGKYNGVGLRGYAGMGISHVQGDAVTVVIRVAEVCGATADRSKVKYSAAFEIGRRSLRLSTQPQQCQANHVAAK